VLSWSSVSRAPAHRVPQSFRRLSRAGSGLVAFVAAVLSLADGVARADSSALPAASPAGARPRASVHVLLRDPDRLAGWLAQHNPDVLAARDRLSQAEADASASRLIPNPTLDVSLSNIPVGETNPGELGFGQVAIWGVGLSETFEIGKRGPRISAADLRRNAERAYLQGTLGDRVWAARSIMGEALHLSLRAATLEESLRDSERVAELERTRYEQSALSGMDYDRLLLELRGLEAEVARSHADYDAARADCRALLGSECDLSGADDSDLTSSAPVPPVGLSERELRERPDLRGLALETEAARRDAELARRRAIPDVTLRIGYVHDDFTVSGDNANTLSVSLALPLPVFDRGQHDADKALARAEELSHTTASTLAGAYSSYAGLVSRERALEASVQTLEKESVPRSSSVVNAAQQAFDHGGVSMTDLLLVRRSHVALRLSLLDQRFELFSVRNDLRRVLGLDARHPGTSDER
jgi:outer membrane protein, heavy metal efflux system